jgi:hypothetical protein
MRLLRRKCCEQALVILGLEALRREFPTAHMEVQNALIYAYFGKDRRQLTMDWVDKARAACIEHVEFERELNAK